MTRKPLGPGPGAYLLPTSVGFEKHDPSRTRAPAYSCGAYRAVRVRPTGPGPSYKIERVTRDGATTSPAWSFGSRFPTRATTRVPGPGAHAPERCPNIGPRAPAYSTGARIERPEKSRGPAPNAYAIRIPWCAPAYSLAPRAGFELKPRSPGPAVYFMQDTNIYMNKPPVFSLGARRGAMHGPVSPGPATYPPNLYNTKKNPYSYSFGTRHNEYAPPMIVEQDRMDCL